MSWKAYKNINSPVLSQGMHPPLVSVVIPTKNSSATIGQCIASIKSENYENLEIIVVDNHSSDNTRQISKRLGAKIIVSRAKRSEARNIGCQNSSGCFLFFVDSDMELTSGVIPKSADKLIQGYDAVIIPEISIGQGFWAKCKALERSCYSGDDLIEGIRFMTRRSFEKIGGYDAKLEAGEDWDLCNRFRFHGCKIARVSEAIKHNEGKLSIQESVRKKYYYSQTLKTYTNKHPLLSRRQLNPLRKAYLRNWRRLLSKPNYTIGFCFMKTCEYVVGIFGYGLKTRENEQHNDRVEIYADRRPEDRKIYMINSLLGQRGFSVLDLGCGNGLYLETISQEAKQVVGLDVSMKLCRMAKKNRFEVVRGDAMHLPFRKAAFDFVWASEIVEHLPSLKIFLELERVALNSIIATLPNPYSSNYGGDSQHLLKYSLASLKKGIDRKGQWNYRLYGLGFELPSNSLGVRIPKIVKLFSLHLTFHIPLFAPTVCIIGRNRILNERN